MVNLYTSPGTGVLSFRSSPSGATVTIDGVDYDGVPVTINNVPVGQHQFVMKLDGYKDFEDIIEVVESKLCCASIDLEAIRSETSCNPQPIEIREIVTPPEVPKPDYKILIIGILVGVIIALIYKDRG
jgi:hypothetical protein